MKLDQLTRQILLSGLLRALGFHWFGPENIFSERIRFHSQCFHLILHIEVNGPSLVVDHVLYRSLRLWTLHFSGLDLSVDGIQHLES